MGTPRKGAEGLGKSTRLYEVKKISEKGGLQVTQTVCLSFIQGCRNVTQPEMTARHGWRHFSLGSAYFPMERSVNQLHDWTLL